jgi:hydrogenase-4 component F
MLAYSSVEHMGILALGAGVGGIAGTGAMLHLVNYSFAKGLLFLVAGNILTIYQTKQLDSKQDLVHQAPRSAFLWMVGFLAITGSPPFGLFFSEWIILKGLIDSGQWVSLVVYLAALFIVFASLARYVIQMTFPRDSSSIGAPHGEKQERSFSKEPLWMWGPPLALSGITLILGLYVPPTLLSFLTMAFTG